MNLARHESRAARGSSKPQLLIIGAAIFLIAALAFGFLFGKYGCSAQRIAQALPESINEAEPRERPANVGEAGPKQLVVDITREFQYLPKGFPMGLASGQTELPPFSSIPPPHLRQAPSATGEILYVTLPLGNVEAETVSVAMANQQQLYFDDNGNGDFTDDAAPCARLSCNRKLTVSVRGRDGSTERRPYTIWFWYIPAQKAPRFYSSCHYAHDIQIGPDTYRAVAFEQRHHNALLRDDGLWIDLDKDGKFAKGEQFTDGQLITVAGQQHQLLLKSP